MFVLLSTVVAGGVVAGLVRGGSLRHLAGVRTTAWVPAALVCAGAMQGLVVLLPPGARERIGWPIVVAGALLATVALIATLRSPILGRAALVALAGWGLNAAVMIPNGGMPVSAHATQQVGFEPAVDERDPQARHVPADDATRLPFLGDVIPVRFGPERGAVSFGDLVLLAAAALAAHDVVRPRRVATVTNQRRSRTCASSATQ